MTKLLLLPFRAFWAVARMTMTPAQRRALGVRVIKAYGAFGMATGRVYRRLLAIWRAAKEAICERS